MKLLYEAKEIVSLKNALFRKLYQKKVELEAFSANPKSGRRTEGAPIECPILAVEYKNRGYAFCTKCVEDSENSPFCLGVSPMCNNFAGDNDSLSWGTIHTYSTKSEDAVSHWE